MQEAGELLKLKDLEFPMDRLYYLEGRSYLWVKVKNGRARVGMSALLLQSVGYLNYITINEGEVEKGDAVGNYESAKFVSRLRTPVSGRITGVNHEALSNPRVVNSSPHDTWLFEVELSSKEELQDKSFIAEAGKLRARVEEELEKLEEE